MVLSGSLRLSDNHARRTRGRFNVLINDNVTVFKRYFGADLFPGSLNVDVPKPSSLQSNLDAGQPTPSIIIPKSELVNMPGYLGNGQAWPCSIRGPKFPKPVECWMFRRIGSIVPPGVIELVAQNKLREVYGLQHGDPITIDVFAKSA